MGIQASGIIDFTRVVQPVLDEYCVECHRGPTPEGAVDLSGDKTRFFNMAYDHLLDCDLVDFHAPFAGDHAESTPRSAGSTLSRICRYIDTDKHCGKTIPLAQRERIYTWIDANVPYYGTWVHNGNDDLLGGRDRWGTGIKEDLVPVFKRRCFGCHQRTVHNPYFAVSHSKATLTSKTWTDRALTAHGFPGFHPFTALLGPEFRINLTHAEWSRMLTAPLAKEAGGMGLCKDKDGKPHIFKDTGDSDYQAMLKAIQRDHKALLARPRVDMLVEAEKRQTE